MASTPEFTAVDGDDVTDITCLICLEPWDGPVEVTPCGHIFCEKCLTARFKRCPHCSGSIASTKPPNRILTNMANDAKVRCTTCSWCGTREESRRHTSCQNAAALPQQQQPRQSVQLRQQPPQPNPPLPQQAPQQPQLHALFPQQLYALGPQQPYPPHEQPHQQLHPQKLCPQQQPQPQPQQQQQLYAIFLQQPYPAQQPEQPQQQPDPQKQQPHPHPQPQPQPQHKPQPQSRELRPKHEQQQQQQPWLGLGMTQEEYDHIVSVFMTFDEDGSGELDRNELKRLCRYLKYAQAGAQVDQMFAEMDTDRSGTLSLHEFCTWLGRHCPYPAVLNGLSRTEYEEVLFAFHGVDSNRDGRLSERDFRTLLKRQGITTSATIASGVFQKLDTDRDGRVTLDEYLSYRSTIRRGANTAPLEQARAMGN